MDRRVLVVDDDAGVAFALSRFLGGQGFFVKLASSAERGLQLIAQETFDLIVLDLRLPGMTGEEALARLHRTHPEIPVIVATAHGGPETEVATRRAGAYAHVLKPFVSAQLLDLVKNAVGVRRCRARGLAADATP